MLQWETREYHRRSRRSVEKDFAFYDPPDRVWRNINSRTWPYSSSNSLSLQLRDLSYMCLLYMTSARSSELCRANLACGPKPSISKNQFVLDGDFLKLRNLIILKRREPLLDEDGKQIHDEHGKPQYQSIQSLDHYPKREEILLPRRGNLAKFTYPILDYLSYLNSNEELFKFKYIRGYQIVNYCTAQSDEDRGDMQHYLRDMGLKLHTRLVDRSIYDLQKYSGHARISSLARYLGEGRLEKNLLNFQG